MLPPPMSLPLNSVGQHISGDLIPRLTEPLPPSAVSLSGLQPMPSAMLGGAGWYARIAAQNASAQPTDQRRSNYPDKSSLCAPISACPPLVCAAHRSQAGMCVCQLEKPVQWLLLVISGSGHHRGCPFVCVLRTGPKHVCVPAPKAKDPVQWLRPPSWVPPLEAEAGCHTHYRVLSKDHGVTVACPP